MVLAQHARVRVPVSSYSPFRDHQGAGSGSCLIEEKGAVARNGIERDYTGLIMPRQAFNFSQDATGELSRCPRIYPWTHLWSGLCVLAQNACRARECGRLAAEVPVR